MIPARLGDASFSLRYMDLLQARAVLNLSLSNLIATSRRRDMLGLEAFSGSGLLVAPSSVDVQDGTPIEVSIAESESRHEVSRLVAATCKISHSIVNS